MQILGINNYYQPKYLNTKQRKTSNIQQLQTNPDSFTFTSRAGYLKVMGYNNLIKLLNDGFNFDYNYKDNMGVSFVEKVIMCENSKLLELIKDKPLEYYPELEYTYKNIQGKRIKFQIVRIGQRNRKIRKD